MEIYKVTYSTGYATPRYTIIKIIPVDKKLLTMDEISSLRDTGHVVARDGTGDAVVCYFDVSEQGMDAFHNRTGWSGIFRRFQNSVVKAIANKKKLDVYINKL